MFLKISVGAVVVLTSFSHVSFASVAGGTENQRAPLTVCSLATDPSKLDGNKISVRARYEGTWEGYYLTDPTCEIHLIDAELHLSDLNQDQRIFNLAVSQLCNAMDRRCKFDYIEADFTEFCTLQRNSE